MEYIQHRDNEACNVFTDTSSYMNLNNLTDVVFFCFSVELTKVIDQRCHAGREVQHPIHQLTKRDFTFMGIVNGGMSVLI